MNRAELLGDLETSLQMVMDSHQAKLWTSMPAMVVNVNLLKMTVDVQPTIKGIITNPDETETAVQLPLLLDCPILFPNGGGFALTFPITVGDEVLIFLASRCIDNWWLQGGVQEQAEFRMHDLSDGFAFVGPKSLPRAVPNISATAAQFRNLLGTTYIGINPTGLIQFRNTTGSLKLVLGGICDLIDNLEIALTAFAGALTVESGAGASLTAALAALRGANSAFKTGVIGGLLE